MSVEGQLRKRRVHAHNGLQGSCAMAIGFVRNVQNMDSTTADAKQVAGEIETMLGHLSKLLRERVD